MRTSFEFLMTRFSLVAERSVSLRTFNDQCITFPFAGDGSYEISVEDSGKNQKKGRIFLFVYNHIMMTNK